MIILFKKLKDLLNDNNNSIINEYVIGKTMIFVISDDTLGHYFTILGDKLFSILWIKYIMQLQVFCVCYNLVQNNSFGLLLVACLI